MNKAILINRLTDRIQDTRNANAALYLIAMSIAHGEGTETDYSSALVLLYETISEQIRDQQQLIDEINSILASDPVTTE